MKKNYHHIIAELKGTWDITFERINKAKVAVTYGLQRKEFDDEKDAAMDFTNCILHLAQCEGKLDDVRELF